MADFDLVILGGGSGGYAAALRASQLESTIVAKNLESEKLMEEAKEKAEQLEEKIKSEMASKKENDKKVSTFKGQLSLNQEQQVNRPLD